MPSRFCSFEVKTEKKPRAKQAPTRGSARSIVGIRGERGSYNAATAGATAGAVLTVSMQLSGAALAAAQAAGILLLNVPLAGAAVAGSAAAGALQTDLAGDLFRPGLLARRFGAAQPVRAIDSSAPVRRVAA